MKPGHPLLIRARRYKLGCAEEWPPPEHARRPFVAKQRSRRLCETDIDPAGPRANRRWQREQRGFRWGPEMRLC